MLVLNLRLAVWLWVLSLALAALAACSPPAPGSATQLEPGTYTPLGGVQKSAQPTSSDLADVQAAEKGALNEPALVEFYADN